MRRISLSLFVALSCLSMGSLWVSCAGKSVNQNDPASLYRDAEDEIKSDHYQVAIDKLREIKNRFPYSKYAVDAQLRIADVYFLQESYDEAAASYEAFRDLHPKHEKAPYALFMAGKSHYSDIPSPIARDMTPAKKALDVLNEFLALYPNAKEATEARKYVEEVRNSLAEKELYVGDFYYNRDFYASAKPRYENVVRTYPDTRAAKTAQEKLVSLEKMSKKAVNPKDGFSGYAPPPTDSSGLTPTGMPMNGY